MLVLIAERYVVSFLEVFALPFDKCKSVGLARESRDTNIVVHSLKGTDGFCATAQFWMASIWITFPAGITLFEIWHTIGLKSVNTFYIIF